MTLDHRLFVADSTFDASFENCLITGGAGFIGLHLARALLAINKGVIILDNFSTQSAKINARAKGSILESGGQIIEGDIRDKRHLGNVFKDNSFDVVFHLASATATDLSREHLGTFTEVNCIGTANLVEIARSSPVPPRKIVLSSSRAVYGEGAYRAGSHDSVKVLARRAEDFAKGDFNVYSKGSSHVTPISSDARRTDPSPVSVYGSSKLYQEHILRQGLKGENIGASILRLQNVFGPPPIGGHFNSGIVPSFFRKIFSGNDIEIYEDGRMVRDFVYVGDVVRALVLAASRDEDHPDPIDIGSGQGIPIRDLADRMIALSGESGLKSFASFRYRIGDIRYGVADTTAAQEVLGWTPEWSLEDGLKQILESADLFECA